MKKNNVGVIGLGVGERHIESYLKFGCKIKKIFDFNKKKMKLIKKKFPSVEICNSENEIFKDPEINIVSIASYDNYHYNQILKCIKYPQLGAPATSRIPSGMRSGTSTRRASAR